MESKILTARNRYWHFLGEDKRLGYGDDRKVQVGKTIKVSGQPILCEKGLHASYRAIDAVQYANGPIICRVMLGGELLVGNDKVAATERTVIAMADATTVLHEFAYWCAKQALETANVTDERCWNAINTKLKWLRGEATDDELSVAESAAWSAAWSVAESVAWSAARSAAESAARSAAWSVARSAAESAAKSVAWSAAWSVAWSAAWSVAWSAARSAAESAQNTHLESKLKALLRQEGCGV